MNVGKVIRPRLTLGAAIDAGSKAPELAQRPNRFAAVNHWKTGRPSQGPQYHKGHPTLMSAATPATLPVRSTQGVNQTALNGYLKALRGGK
jgi:hypothetical protein